MQDKECLGKFQIRSTYPQLISMLVDLTAMEIGNAELVLSPDQSYLKDEDGYIELHARFNKNKKMTLRI